MVQRAVNVETKAGLRSSTIVRDSDICCPKGHHPSNSTVSKMQTQRITAKDSSCPEKSKAKETKFVCANTVEPLEQDKKDNKDQRDKKWKKGKKGNGVTPRPLATISLTPQKRRKRTKIVISMESRIITETKKATLQIPAPSQKTSIGLGNFCIGD